MIRYRMDGLSAATSPEQEIGASSGSSTSSNVANDSRFTDPDRPSALLKGIVSLYEEKLFSDITLIVMEKEFPCHRNILAISSPYFMTMFSTDLVEKGKDRITLQEMDAQTMDAVLTYIYTGQVTLSEDIVQNLLSAANLFQLLALRNGCASFMMKHISVNNCIGVYFFARAHQCEQLATKAKEMINSQFENLYQEKEFLELPCDKLVEIIKDDKLIVSKEEIVFEACHTWLMTDITERKQHLYTVMQHVRFANISSYYFCDNIDVMELTKEDEDLAKLLNKAKYYHMLKNRQSEIDLNFVPRQGMPYERGVIIMANPYTEDNSCKFNSMEVLLPQSGTIKHLCKLPQSLYMPSACTTGDNQIFLGGGAIRKFNYRGPFITEGVSSNLFVYDKNFGSWQVRAKMLQGRCQFCLVVLDGLIYAIGGQNETSILDSVECYDQQLNSWKGRAPLPEKLHCMTAVAYKGKIYVFGGENASEITKAAFRYDANSDTWMTLPNLKEARALAGSVVYQDHIYIIGGNSSISSKWKKEFLPEHCVSMVEVFDPVDNTWSVGPELPNALCGAGVVKYGDSLLVVGGEDDKSWMAGLFALSKDGSGNEHWVESQELPMVLSTFACVVANVPRDLITEPDSCH